MVTSGMDAMLKVWDIRTYQQLHSIHLHKPTTDLSVSQKGGLVATGHGKHCQVGSVTVLFSVQVLCVWLEICAPQNMLCKFGAPVFLAQRQCNNSYGFVL